MMGYLKSINFSQNYLRRIKEFIKKHKILTGFTLLFLLFTAITNKYGPYMGKVIDAETGEPIVGAVVYMVFYTQTPHPAGSWGHYAGAVEALTDINGEFKFSYRAFTFHPFSFWDPWPIQEVYKPEYVIFPGKIGDKKATILPEKRRMPGIPEKQYVIIKLPKLETRKERLSVSPDLRNFYVPYKKRQHITDLYNQERVNLGLTPGVK